MPVAKPLIDRIGLDAYLRSCRDTGQPFVLTHIKVFARMPRFPEPQVSAVPHRRSGEWQ